MFRSLLFIPGNNPSMIQNADIFLSDAIIFDLEDSVSISEKDNARNLILNFLLTKQSFAQTIILRVNPVDTSFFKDDLKLLSSKRIDYVLLPKATKENLDILNEELFAYEKENDLKETKTIALVEQAKSIIEVETIAEKPRVEALFLGAEDLCNDLEIERTGKGKEILFARSKVIYAAAANNIISIDTPYTDIYDEEGLRKDALRAYALGMKAKACIHPNQLEIVNEVFSPKKAQIEWAKKVLVAYEENLKIGKGAFKVDGKMIDKPIIEKAQKIIDKAKKYQLL